MVYYYVVTMPSAIVVKAYNIKTVISRLNIKRQLIIGRYKAAVDAINIARYYNYKRSGHLSYFTLNLLTDKP